MAKRHKPGRPSAEESAQAAPPFVNLLYKDGVEMSLTEAEYRRMCEVVAEDREIPHRYSIADNKVRPAGFRGYLEIIEERE